MSDIDINMILGKATRATDLSWLLPPKQLHLLCLWLVFTTLQNGTPEENAFTAKEDFLVIPRLTSSVIVVVHPAWFLLFTDVRTVLKEMVVSFIKSQLDHIRSLISCQKLDHPKQKLQVNEANICSRFYKRGMECNLMKMVDLGDLYVTRTVGEHNP
jgi:hypothetical protein